MLDYAHLSAVAAVIRTGSFERAARSLGLTSSAVSQRVRQIEERLGAVLIVRGQPCMATDAGERLCRHADEVELLERMLDADLGAPRALMPTLRIAVNADSLATWFVAAMAGAGDYLFDLVIDDQDHGIERLRRGDVRATVSAFEGSVQGCDCCYLGDLRYIATASPAFIARWFPEGVTAEALARAPCLVFNAKDMLQTRFLRQMIGRDVSPPQHWLPSSQAFIDAALAGVGWGLNPEILVATHIADGRMLPLAADRPVDTPLYWHWSRSLGRAVAPVTTAVTTAARAALRQAGR